MVFTGKSFAPIRRCIAVDGGEPTAELVRRNPADAPAADVVPISNDINILIEKYEYLQQLTNNLETNKIDTNTLNRKSFYESQQFHHLLWWNWFFFIVYYILSVILILVLFFSENQFHLTTYSKGGISIVLLIYPQLVGFIHSSVLSIYNFFAKFWTKNVYNSL
jgi:hypothetical protein